MKIYWRDHALMQRNEDLALVNDGLLYPTFWM
jgi:hypothetical protein